MFLTLVILLLPFMVTPAPLDNEEDSNLIPVDVHHGRPRASPFTGSHVISPLAFLSSPFNRRGKADPEKPLLQGVFGMVPKDHMDKGALQRKEVWENNIKNEKPRSYPDQVLPLEQHKLKSRCNALPFVQNIFRQNCAPLRIPNKFCFGQCNSFYIPGWPVGLSQPCTSCSPVRTRRITVPLQCHGGRFTFEEVVLVEECRCETRFDQDFDKSGSGGGFLPVS